MKFLIQTLIVVFFSLHITGQNISPKVVSTSGNNISNSSYSLSYNIGEIATETLNNNNYMISQGFLQPFNQENYVKLVAENMTFIA
ncbi:MAG: hypothetical protein ABIJ97_08195, partial [Bacteroidota bacterium]